MILIYLDIVDIHRTVCIRLQIKHCLVLSCLQIKAGGGGGGSCIGFVRVKSGKVVS